MPGYGEYGSIENGPMCICSESLGKKIQLYYFSFHGLFKAGTGKAGEFLFIGLDSELFACAHMPLGRAVTHRVEETWFCLSDLWLL